MFTLDAGQALAAVSLTLLAGLSDAPAAETYGIGRVATEQEIRGWDIDVRADGQGLPPGRGSVAQGAGVYAAKCIACHGEGGRGGPMDRLSGGRDTLASAVPVRTIGSYWPYATTLFDYIRRAMPFNAPQSLNADEVYALSAYLLFANGILPADAALDATSLPRVAMPNREHFASDPRPDVSNVPCASACPAGEAR
jgi:S-disulfanyl-L-cysteine oxidoreductase SoxD